MVSQADVQAMTQMVLQFLKMQVIPGVSILLICTLVFAAGFAWFVWNFFVNSVSE